MPAVNRQGDVLQALRDVTPQRLTLAEVCVAADIGPNAARRHLHNLVKTGHVLILVDAAPPYRRRWQAKPP